MIQIEMNASKKFTLILTFQNELKLIYYFKFYFILKIMFNFLFNQKKKREIIYSHKMKIIMS